MILRIEIGIGQPALTFSKRAEPAPNEYAALLITNDGKNSYTRVQSVAGHVFWRQVIDWLEAEYSVFNVSFCLDEGADSTALVARISETRTPGLRCL